MHAGTAERIPPRVRGGRAPVTNHTERVSGLWVTSWIVLLVVGVITWGLTIWAVIAYRRRKGQTGLPVQLRYNMPIEVFYTIVPLILVLGFFAFTARDQQAIEQRFAADEVDVKIEVIAKQWAWDFNYVNEDVYSPGIQGQLSEEGPAGSVEQEGCRRWCPSGPERRDRARGARRHPLVLGRRLPLQEGHVPGQDQLHVVRPRARGHVRGQVRRALRRVPLAHALQRRGRLQAEYEDYIESLRDAGQEGQLSNEYDRNQNLPGTGELKEEGKPR